MTLKMQDYLGSKYIKGMFVVDFNLKTFEISASYILTLGSAFLQATHKLLKIHNKDSLK
jgi:hypothetical protein